MNIDNLCFYTGSKIKVEEVTFVVDGHIIFRDESGASWTEYKIKSTENSEVRWLSVDTLHDEYAIYSEETYSKDFLEETIITNCYKKIDSKSATVVDFKGNIMDIDLGEKVNYREYENSTEKFLLSIEEWQGECEYSKGHYIDKDSIEMLSPELNHSYNSLALNNREDSGGVNNNKTIISIIIGIILIAISITVVFKNCSSSNEKKEILSKFITSHNNFEYVTSITSDLDKDKKANVYSINKSVGEATRLIIDGVKGNIKDVQENVNDGTVVITSEDELGLIYMSEDSKTLIQISTREYVYSSRTTPYRSTNITNSYYRTYYYNSFYNEDKKIYSNSLNGYSDYKGGVFTANNNNKYKTYVDSIRQSSTSTRPSSGDGISAGK